MTSAERDGLRAFLDKRLKPLQTGRNWIQVYYRHSPELAMLLVKKPDARRAAVQVIEHFSKLGRAFSQHQALEALQRALATIQERGSQGADPACETRRELPRWWWPLLLPL